MKILSKEGIGIAFGKIILIGEHAVVYQKPAIAFPFKACQVKITIQEIQTASYVVSDYYTGLLSDIPEHLNNFFQTIQEVSSYLEKSVDHLKFIVESTIPAERGMGSSAAVASALVRSLFDYFNTKLPLEVLHRFVAISEKIAHGNPSGIDTTIVTSETPIYYIKDKVLDKLDISLDGFLICADTGIKGNTKEAVSDVAKLVHQTGSKAMHHIQHLAHLTDCSLEALRTNSLPSLGDYLSKAHRSLSELTVSNDALNHLVAHAQNAGALGAKLTGGGRGGCMIALAEDYEHAQSISKELLKAGAIKTWVYPLGEES